LISFVHALLFYWPSMVQLAFNLGYPVNTSLPLHNNLGHYNKTVTFWRQRFTIIVLSASQALTYEFPSIEGYKALLVDNQTYKLDHLRSNPGCILIAGLNFDVFISL